MSNLQRFVHSICWVLGPMDVLDEPESSLPPSGGGSLIGMMMLGRWGARVARRHNVNMGSARPLSSLPIPYTASKEGPFSTGDRDTIAPSSARAAPPTKRHAHARAATMPTPPPAPWTHCHSRTCVTIRDSA